MTEQISDDQPTACKLCGYELQWGDMYVIHTVREHPAAFITKVIMKLPDDIQSIILDKNRELFE